MVLDRNFITIEEPCYWVFCFDNFIKESHVLCKKELGSIHPTISQKSIIRYHGFPIEFFCSQDHGERQGIECMQVYHEAHGVQ